MGKHILIVEDDEDIGRNLKLFLESEGFIAEVVTNGKLALDHLEGAQPLPSLIFLDLMMPVMDGFEFCMNQEKDARISSIPVVVMTAAVQLEEKTFSQSVRALVKKPFQLEDLLSAIHLHAKSDQ